MMLQGARRVEQRWDPSQNGQIVPDDKRVGRKLADDAMYKVIRELEELISHDEKLDIVNNMVYHVRWSIRSQTWTSRGMRLQGSANCHKFR